MTTKNSNNEYTLLVCTTCEMQYWECEECFVKVEKPKHHICWEHVPACNPYSATVRNNSLCKHPSWNEHSSPSVHDSKMCHLCNGYRTPRVYLTNGWERCNFCLTTRKHRTGYGNRSFTHQFRCHVIKSRNLFACYCPKVYEIYSP